MHLLHHLEGESRHLPNLDSRLGMMVLGVIYVLSLSWLW